MDYKFATTNVHSTAAAIIMTKHMLPPEVLAKSGGADLDGIAHVVDTIGKIPIGWWAWNVCSTLYATMSQPLQSERRSWETATGLNQLPWTEYNPLTKGVSTMIRAFNKLPFNIYGLPCKIVKQAKGILVEPLQFLINLSFEQGKVPHQLKQTRVTYIQKKANSCEINDLRPISINSVPHQSGTLIQRRIDVELRCYVEGEISP